MVRIGRADEEDVLWPRFFEHTSYEASSLKKRYGEARFAAKVDRKVIERGCEALGVSVDDHIANLVKFLGAMK